MGRTESRMQSVPVLEPSEDRLEELETFRLLADEAKDYAIIMLDTEGRVLHWNAGAQRLKGYSAGEIVGESFTRFYTAEDIAAGKPALALEQAASEGRFEGEGWRVRKNGDLFWANVIITALHDKSGQVMGFAKLVRDQSERKQIVEALQTSELRYRQLVMLLPVAVYTTDNDGRVTLYNQQAVQLFGREPQIGVDLWCGSHQLYRLDGTRLPHSECPMAVLLREGPEACQARGQQVIVERPDGSRSYVLPFPKFIHSASGQRIGAVNVLIDLTARRQAEEACRESESYLRVLIDNLPCEFWARNREGRCTMQNATITNHWGNVLGRLPEESALSPEEAVRWRSNNRRAFSGETVQEETQYTIGGQTRNFQEIIAPVRVDGDIRGILGLNIDITEHKSAELLVRRNEQQLRAFIEQAPVAIAMFDTQMRYLAASSRWLSAHGLSADVVGVSHYVVSPQIPDRWKQVHQRALAGAVERCEEDVFIREDGQSVWLMWEVRPWLTATGEVGGIVIFIEDITQRKQAEKALLQSEKRFRSLAEGIPQLVWTCTPDGQCDYLSRQWGDYTGTPCSEQLGEKWADAVYPEDLERVGQAWRGAAIQPTTFELEYRLKRYDGQYRWFKTIAIPIFDDARRVTKWFGTCTDIQTQKDTEAALNRAREQEAHHASILEQEVAERTASLRTIISELEAFSYSVSHDLRSPLRAMQGYSQVLLEEYANCLDDQGRSYLARIARAAGRLDHLVQDILAYSRVARAQLPLTCVDLEVLIDDVIQNYPSFQSPRAEITIQRPILPVIGNEGSLTQCLSNLLANAIKFVAPGIFPQIKIWTEPIDTQVRLWIEDNGIGIDRSHFDRIFQIFGRVHPDEAFEGTGIGLSIVKKAVERMNGTLGVESKFGQGSRFWIQLPGQKT